MWHITIVGRPFIEPLPARYRQPMHEFRLLGPLEVVADGKQLALGGTRQRSTLAILLLHANRVVSVERLAEELYAGAPPVTAVTQVQRQISDLRKALGDAAVIETRAPGYAIRLGREQLDLACFERRTHEAAKELSDGELRRAADLYREALALWRGAPLADLAYESFAQPAIARLEELRLSALEQLFETELALGRHAEIVPEVEEALADEPVRERLAAALMLALYRSGRQAEALEVYRRTREALVDGFGIEPTATLRELERSILAQDAGLDPGGTEQDSGRVVLVLPSADSRIAALAAAAQPLGDELIVARLLADGTELEPSVAALNGHRSPRTRVAAFTTDEPASDAVHLAAAYDAHFVLLDAPAELEQGTVPPALADLLAASPVHVGILTSRESADGEGVYVPFGGSEHDWAALEVGASIAAARGEPLRVVGRSADPARSRRDASRLLADASLAVQRVVGVDAAPILTEPTSPALLGAVEPAALVVAGLSPRWRRDGLTVVREALVRDARPPVLLVHRGLRPGLLAPRDSRTRYTWSLEPEVYLQAVASAPM